MKIINRFIVLLLVPCLTANTVTGSDSFVFGLKNPTLTIDESSFGSQALASTSDWVHSLVPQHASRTYRWIARKQWQGLEQRSMDRCWKWMANRIEKWIQEDENVREGKQVALLTAPKAQEIRRSISDDQEEIIGLLYIAAVHLILEVLFTGWVVGFFTYMYTGDPLVTGLSVMFVRPILTLIMGIRYRIENPIVLALLSLPPGFGVFAVPIRLMKVRPIAGDYLFNAFVRHFVRLNRRSLKTQRRFIRLVEIMVVKPAPFLPSIYVMIFGGFVLRLFAIGHHWLIWSSATILYVGILAGQYWTTKQYQRRAVLSVARTMSILDIGRRALQKEVAKRKIIRPAREEDLPSILNLRVVSFSPETAMKLGEWVGESEFVKNFKSHLSGNDFYRLFVIEFAGSIIGQAECGMVSPGVVRFAELAVEESFRRIHLDAALWDARMHLVSEWKGVEIIYGYFIGGSVRHAVRYGFQKDPEILNKWSLKLLSGSSMGIEDNPLHSHASAARAAGAA